MTCVKSSQGFDWNQGITSSTQPSNDLETDQDGVTELFLPSYAHSDYDSHELEHKQDPVQDIILTDEEAAAMLPQ